jgi:cobalt/nickel transport system permease protein
MHIPNGFLDPKISAGLSFAAAGALGYCFSKIREAVTSTVMQEAFAAAGGTVSSISGKARRVLAGSSIALLSRMFAVGALILTAQMFDFIVIGGTSGHLLGCAFSGIALGPWAGGLVMAGVLAIQCVFLGDGGLFALGANIFNMAVIGTVGGYYIYYAVKKLIPGKAGYYSGVAIASWVSVVIAAALTALEVGFSGTYEVGWSLNSMLSVHVFVGVAEALMTIAILGLLGKRLLESE